MNFTEPHSWPSGRDTTTLSPFLSLFVALTGSHERLISPSFVFICSMIVLLNCIDEEGLFLELFSLSSNLEDGCFWSGASSM